MFSCQFLEIVVILVLAIASGSGATKEGTYLHCEHPFIVDVSSMQTGLVWEELLALVFLRTLPNRVVIGDACTLGQSDRGAPHTGLEGVCIHLANCPSIQETILEGLSPQVCFTEGTVPIVCCPSPSSSPVTALISPGLPDEGSSCTVERTGKPGTCKRFADCAIAREAAAGGVFPQRCISSKEDPICCEVSCPQLPPGTLRPKTGSKSEDYCSGLVEKLYPCQNTVSGWTRGNLCPSVSSAFYTKVSISTAEIPHWVWLAEGERQNMKLVCGGSLISERWVLATAYSLYTRPNLKYAQPVGGQQIYDIIRTIPNPSYNYSYSWVYNDIALVELGAPVAFTNRILPACLHTGTPLPAGGLDHIGWDNNMRSYSKTNVAPLSTSECSKRFPRNPNSLWWKEAVRSTQICTQPRTAPRECGIYENGSPVQMQSAGGARCTALLVGASVYGEGCLYVSTRVSNFIPWIEGLVWP